MGVSTFWEVVVSSSIGQTATLAIHRDISEKAENKSSASIRHKNASCYQVFRRVFRASQYRSGAMAKLLVEFRLHGKEKMLY